VSKALYERAETEPVIKIKYLASVPEKVIVVGEPTDETEGRLEAAAVLLFEMGDGGISSVRSRRVHRRCLRRRDWRGGWDEMMRGGG
jgi:hypothetical protein